MKIKFNSDDELPLNKMIQTPSMIIAVRAVFIKVTKIFQKVFRWMSIKTMNKIKMLYYDRIGITEWNDINKTIHEWSGIFVITGIFKQSV